MSERARNLAQSRRRATAAKTSEVTVLAAVHPQCKDGLHLWCPGKAGRYLRHPCACVCHTTGAPERKTRKRKDNT